MSAWKPCHGDSWKWRCIKCILGALLAQGLDTELASRYGVTLHAKAGDDLARRDGQHGMLASDLFSAVRVLMNQ